VLDQQGLTLNDLLSTTVRVAALPLGAGSRSQSEMSREAAIWFVRFMPMLTVVVVGVAIYVMTKRHKPVSYSPGRGLRLFDKDGNEIKGPLRIVTAVVLVIMLIAALVAVILPFTAP
jgi:hypothetical protein